MKRQLAVLAAALVAMSAVSPAVADYTAREQVQPESKARVARAAARLVAPGSTVLLDGGTTTLAVARALPHDLRATVVTHSPTVAVALADRPGIDVQIIGGRLYRHSMVACGALAVEAASQVGADLFLLGVTGVHPEAGLTTGDAEEAAMKQHIARGRPLGGDGWVQSTVRRLSLEFTRTPPCV